MDNITKLHQSWKTVFKRIEIGNILGFTTKKSLEMFIYRALKKGSIVKIHYGIYALWKYNSYELASKIKQKSYISLESSLKDHWVIFQYYESIFSVSDDSLEKVVQGQKYIYRKMQDSILLNSIGIIHKWNYMIASKERAICDRIYFTKDYYFDNLNEVDFIKLEEISQIYNKRVKDEIKKLIIDYAT